MGFFPDPKGNTVTAAIGSVTYNIKKTGIFRTMLIKFCFFLFAKLLLGNNN